MSQMRLHPKYRLINISDLTSKQRELIGSSGEEARYVACLWAVGDAKPEAHKMLNRPALSLLECIARNEFSEIELSQESLKLAIDRLVFDGLVEVLKRGDYVSGPSAFSLMERSEAYMRVPGNYLNRLSSSAIDHALAYPEQSLGEIAAKLYRYNRRPLSPNRSLQYHGQPDSGIEYLGFGKREIRACVSDCWERVRPLSKSAAEAGYDDAWAFWRRNLGNCAAGKQTGRYKLYLSLRYEFLAQSIIKVITVINQSEANAFKIGRKIKDLLRPDYFIIYFESFSQLERTATALEGAVEIADALGVPFTCAMNDAGSLSWGVDEFKSGSGSNTGYSMNSWRSLICWKLASALVQTAYLGRDRMQERISLSLSRLEMEGVDTHNWCPKAGA